MPFERVVDACDPSRDASASPLFQTLFVFQNQEVGSLDLGSLELAPLSSFEPQAQFDVTLVLAPMIFFGCTYYPWSALSAFPALQKLVLVNPIVYASEGLRAILAPHLPHLPTLAIFGALALFDVIFLVLGLKRFRAKAIG